MAEHQNEAQFSWNPTLDGMPEELIISVFYYCPTIELLRLSMASTKFSRLVKSPRLDLANDLYDLAVDETNRLDSVASMKILNTLLFIFPNYYKGWRKRNDCWLQLNEPLLALEDLIKANKVCDDPVYSKLIQSEFHSLQKEYDKVLQVIEEAYALAPEDPVVLHHRAYAYGLVVPDGEEQAKAHEREIELYKEILDMPYKRQLMIHNNLAYCYFQIEQDDLAFEHYDKAIALCPHFVKAYINKATLHFERSEFEEVLKDCDTILSINPNFSEAYGWKASAHLGLENLPEALKFMTIAHARTMHDPFFAFLYYTLMIKLGHIDKVLSDIAQEMKLYIDEMNKLLAQLAELKQSQEDDGYNHLRIMAVQRKKNTYRKLVRICRQKRGEVFLLDGKFDAARVEMYELKEIYRVGDLDNSSGTEPSTTKRLLLMDLMLNRVIGEDHSVIRPAAVEFSHTLLHMSMPLDADAQEFLNNVLTQLPQVSFTEVELKYLVLAFDYKSRYIDPFFPTEFTYATEDIHYFNTFWVEPGRTSSSLQDLMYSYRY